MKNKIVLLLLIFFSAGIYSAKAQSKQQNMQQKWKDEMEQRKKHHDEVVAKAHEQQRQLQFEKAPEQVTSPVQQQPQIKTGNQQNSQPIVPVKKDEVGPTDSKKFKSANKLTKKQSVD